MSGAVRKEEDKPLNKMNKAELLEACKLAGVNPPEGATNAQLVALLEAPAAPAAPDTNAAEEAAKAIEAVDAAAKRGYFVAEGKSLTSKKGIVAAGDRVTAANWDGETLEKLVNSGAVNHVK